MFFKGSIYLKVNLNLLIYGCVLLNEDGSFMFMNIMGKEYKGKVFMDKMEFLVREGFFFKDKVEEKLYGMDIMWYLWIGKCLLLFGKDDMIIFERYFIVEKEIYKENKNLYFKFRENEMVCKRLFEEFDLEFDEFYIINGYVFVESKNGESLIKVNGKIFVIDGGFFRVY